MTCVLNAGTGEKKKKKIRKTTVIFPATAAHNKSSLTCGWQITYGIRKHNSVTKYLVFRQRRQISYRDWRVHAIQLEPRWNIIQKFNLEYVIRYLGFSRSRRRMDWRFWRFRKCFIFVFYCFCFVHLNNVVISRHTINVAIQLLKPRFCSLFRYRLFYVEIRNPNFKF